VSAATKTEAAIRRSFGVRVNLASFEMKKVAGKRARWKEVLVGKMRIFRRQLLVE